jgi:hypothetical protein
MRPASNTSTDGEEMRGIPKPLRFSLEWFRSRTRPAAG